SWSRRRCWRLCWPLERVLPGERADLRTGGRFGTGHSGAAGVTRPSDIMVTQPRHGRRPISRDRSPAVVGFVFRDVGGRRAAAARPSGGRRRRGRSHRVPVLRRSGRGSHRTGPPEEGTFYCPPDSFSRSAASASSVARAPPPVSLSPPPE